MQQVHVNTLSIDSDYELVSRIRLGDDDAVSAMYRKYARYIAAIAYRLMGNDADLDDIVQDTFVTAVKCIGSVRDATVLKTWLATIAVRSTSRYAAARRRQLRFVEKKMFEVHGQDFAAPTHGDRMEAHSLIGQIPYKYRAPWILCKVLEMNLEETSKLCDCSVATSKRRIARAEKLIRRIRDEH